MKRDRNIPGLLLATTSVLALVASGCSPQATSTSTAPNQTVETEASQVLALMPVNSDRRCLGIAIVMEALLQTKRLTPGACESGETLAEKLYANLRSPSPLRIPQFIEIDGVRQPVLSREALETLSTLVADQYKQDYARSFEGAAIEWPILDESADFVASTTELMQILDADVDRRVAFCGVGLREFPDGELRDTDHVFLLHAPEEGRVVVYDPNDPGAPLACEVDETEDGLLVQWTCRYRDTGVDTIQAYRIVSANSYFTRAFHPTANTPHAKAQRRQE